MTQERRTLEPDAARQALYRRHYEVYCEVYRGLGPAYRLLSEMGSADPD